MSIFQIMRTYHINIRTWICGTTIIRVPSNNGNFGMIFCKKDLGTIRIT